ncbi:hypothetical protein GH733_007465 [Mirounga leonina]|nr:hypothetical protein GH733_007465 [Mirounga leonina]
MASRGRKRKAEGAVVAAAAKQEKPAGGRKAVEAATVHELTRLRAQRRGPEPGAAPGDPGASGGGESCQAPEGQLRVSGGAGAGGRRWAPPAGTSAFGGHAGAFQSVELWTGIKKGPPRKLKFPEPQEVVKELKKHLS